MGQYTNLEQTSDPTGTMSQTDLNSQDISNIIDAVNILQESQTANFQQNTYNLIINDGTVDRIIIGLLPDNTWGIVVSAPGVSVESLFS